MIHPALKQLSSLTRNLMFPSKSVTAVGLVGCMQTGSSVRPCMNCRHWTLHCASYHSHIPHIRQYNVYMGGACVQCAACAIASSAVCVVCSCMLDDTKMMHAHTRHSSQVPSLLQLWPANQPHHVCVINQSAVVVTHQHALKP